MSTTAPEAGAPVAPRPVGPSWRTAELDALPAAEHVVMAVNALIWLVAIVPAGYLAAGVPVPAAFLALVPAVLVTRPWDRLPRATWLLPAVLGATALVVLAVTPGGWTASRFAGYFLFPALGLTVTAAYATTAARRRAVAAVVCAVGLVVFVEGWVRWWQGGRPDALMSAPVGWHNQLAAFLLGSGLVGLILALSARGWLRALGAATALLGGVGIVLTTSRAGLALYLLGWVAAGGYLLASGRRGRVWLGWVLIPIGVAAITAVLTSHLFFPHAAYHVPFLQTGAHASRGTATMAENTTTRLLYMHAALRSWLHAPLLGNGFGSFLQTSAHYLPRGAVLYAVPYNSWLDALTSGGLVFAVPFSAGTVLLAGAVGRGLWHRRADLAGADAGVAVASALAFLLLLAHFAFDVDIDYPACGGMIAVVGGLALAGARPKPARPLTGRLAPLPAAALTGVALLGCVCGLIG